jgi:xylulokinase
MTEVTIGIDIGTTSVKAVAADGDGRILRRTRIAHGVQSPEPATLQHDANKAWRRNVRRAHRDVSEGLAVKGIQVAAMVPSLAPVSARGSALGPGLLYGDRRGGADPGLSPAESGELVGFLGWLAAQYPDAAGYWPAQAVANHALCGEGVIDSTTAMTAVPLFDYVGWDPVVAREAGVEPSQLPRVSSGPEPVGEVDGAVLGGGTIDALGEQWVAGANDPGDVLVICGASLITWAVVPEWVEVDGLWTVPHTVAGRSLVGGPSNAGGLFVDWALDLFGLRRVGTSSDPDAVPLWTPYPKGERTPLHDPARLAGLHDLAITCERPSLRRAVYEAPGFVVRHHLDLAGIEGRRIVAVGGGSRSDEWMQALADTTGLPVHVTAVAEGAALGAAFLARVTAGLEEVAEDASRWARTGRVVDPDPAWTEAVDQRYQRFRELS